MLLQIVDDLKGRHLVPIGLGVALIVTSFLAIDKPLTLWLAHHTPYRISHVANMITKLGLGWPYFVGLPFLAFVCYRFKSKQAAAHLTFIWASVCIGGLIADVFKIVLSRARPALLLHQNIYGFYGLQLKAKFWSFPSGHATVAMCFAIAGAFCFRRFRWFFLIYGLLLSFSRVVVLAHYLSDIMAALLLSFFVVLYLRKHLSPLIYQQFRDE